MKKLIEITAAVKTLGAVIFAGLVIVYTVLGGFFGQKEISFALIWQALFIALIASGLKFLSFSDTHIKKARFKTRILLFSVPLFTALAVFAYFFKWFDTGNALNWLAFCGVYLFFFGAVTLAFHMYSAVTGKRYAELLDAYKRKHNV